MKKPALKSMTIIAIGLFSLLFILSAVMAFLLIRQHTDLVELEQMVSINQAAIAAFHIPADDFSSSPITPADVLSSVSAPDPAQSRARTRSVAEEELARFRQERAAREVANRPIASAEGSGAGTSVQGNASYPIGTKLTNRGFLQKWIGVVIACDDQTVRVRFTYCRDAELVESWRNGEMKRGKEMTFVLNEVKRLRGRSLHSLFN